jgi:DNA-binding SARP family transcriptional activator
MQAEDAAGRSVLPRSRKTRGVLAVLALAASRPVLRTRLTGLLWSRRGAEQARASLRQSVHELQQIFGPSLRALLHTDRNHLLIVSDNIWVDVSRLAQATVYNPDALDLFAPAILDDLNGLDPAFDAWITEERQRTTLHARSVAEGLLGVAATTSARVVISERLLSIDKAHEGAWQALIRAHVDDGDRAAARSAYERCVAALSDVGLAPSDETMSLVIASRHVQSTAASSPKVPHLDRGTRLVVLPSRALDNSGSDNLLPGLAEEITAALSRFRGISCTTARLPGDDDSSTVPWRRFDPDLLLDSALQRSGSRIRVIIRLLDIRAAGSVVWASRFDREMTDVLTLQGEIAATTVARLDPELLINEGYRPVSGISQKPTAHDLILRAIPPIYRLEASGFRAAGELLAAAAAMEPGNAAAYAWWAYWHVCLIGQGWTEDPDAATRRAGELAERAVTLDPGDARALTLVGHVRGYLYKRAEEARALYERALSLNPNLPLAWCFSGLAKSWLGRHDEAIVDVSRAHRLSPHDPHAFFFNVALMMPHFFRGDFGKAVALGRRAVELNPGFSSTYKGYLATLGHLGDEQEARRIRKRLLDLEPKFSIKGAIERSPLRQRDDIQLYAEGLRRAGLREG